jgi:hypothetical protein
MFGLLFSRSDAVMFLDKNVLTTHVQFGRFFKYTHQVTLIRKDFIAQIGIRKVEKRKLQFSPPWFKYMLQLFKNK